MSLAGNGLFQKLFVSIQYSPNTRKYDTVVLQVL